MRIFNRIRHSLLNEGKFLRYLRYAVGEIILVVIGILLALSINSWNTLRMERQQEKQILYQIKAEYEDNRLQLIGKVKGRLMINKAANKLLEYQDDPAQIDPDSLAAYISATLFRPTFDPATGVMDELVNSGKLYLIENDSLRILLTNWYGKYFTEVREEEQVTMDFIESEYLPFLLNNYQLRNAHYSLNQQSPMDYLWFTFDKKQYQSFLTPSKSQDDGSRLFIDGRFENYISSLILYHTVANNQSGGVIEKMDKTLELIDKELDK